MGRIIFFAIIAGSLVAVPAVAQLEHAADRIRALCTNHQGQGCDESLVEDLQRLRQQLEDNGGQSARADSSHLDPPIPLDPGNPIHQKLRQQLEELNLRKKGQRSEANQ